MVWSLQCFSLFSDAVWEDKRIGGETRHLARWNETKGNTCRRKGEAFTSGTSLWMLLSFSLFSKQAWYSLYDINHRDIVKKDMYLKVEFAAFLLDRFVYLKESTCETRKNIFYFTSKVLFVLEIIRFSLLKYSNIMTSSNA